jgi:hypothetical protein
MLIALAHSAAQKNEIKNQHKCERVSQPIDLAPAAAERLNNCRFIGALPSLRGDGPQGRSYSGLIAAPAAGTKANQE